MTYLIAVLYIYCYYYNSVFNPLQSTEFNGVKGALKTLKAITFLKYYFQVYPFWHRLRGAKNVSLQDFKIFKAKILFTLHA